MYAPVILCHISEYRLASSTTYMYYSYETVCFNYISTSQNINIFALKCLVHTSYGTEFPTHRTAFLNLRLSVVTDFLCRFGVDGALPLLVPVKGSASVSHCIVDVHCVRNMLCNVRSVCGDLRCNDALFYILNIRECGIPSAC